jgi:hypothetical protein
LLNKLLKAIKVASGLKVRLKKEQLSMLHFPWFNMGILLNKLFNTGLR